MCTLCGREECLHGREHVLTKECTDPETGVSFERENCGKCGAWLGDRVLSLVA